MTPEERKRLKKEGKQRVERESAELTKRLAESNPFDIGDPRWAEAYKEEVRNNKKIRQNITEVYSAKEVSEFAEVIDTGTTLEDGMFPINTYYVECRNCGDFVPTNARKDVSCSCNAVQISFVTRRYTVPQEGQYRLVRLSGVNTTIKKSKWWHFWR